MIFSVQNPFRESAQAGFLNGYGGGVGVQYNLDPQRALRFAVNLSRSSNPVVKTETQTNGGPVTTNTVVPAQTSAYATALGASYLLRLTRAAVAPYLGAGASLSWDSTARDGTDPDGATPISYDDSTRTIGLGLVGQLGLEWRVHKSISIFAEYGLNVSAFSWENTDNKTTTGVNVTQVKSSSKRFFNFDTGLNQGAEIGLIALF
jgi:hypothetical protein